MKIRSKKMKVIALLMPLVIAIIWLIIIVSSNRTILLGDGGAQLAPISDTEPLIIGLSVFVVGYMLFMVMMFYDDINTFFVRNKVHNLLSSGKKSKKK